MIQRIQTIHLLIAFLISGVCAYLIFGKEAFYDPYNFLIEIPHDQYQFSFRFLENSLFLVAGISFITIFLFKKRSVQRFFCILNQLFNLSIFTVLVYYIRNTDINTMSYQELFLLFTPLFSMIFTSLALAGIKKDEALIKSMDRLR
jgi:hypothetical protein